MVFLPFKVKVYSKEACCLCDKAKELLHKVAEDYPLEMEEIDITTDPKLWQTYKESIPVITLNGKIVFRGKVSELWLRRELEKIN